MKLINIATLSMLAIPTEAVFNKIMQRVSDNFDAVIEANGLSPATKKEAQESGMPMQGARALKKTDLAVLQGYGCWCYFEEERGKGQPVDDYDSQCKVLQDGYECLRLDAEKEQLDCDIWTVEYNSAVGFGGISSMNIEALKLECDNSNGGPNTCESRLCRVEGWFVQNIILLMFQKFQVPNPTFQHQSMNFDPSIECQVKPGVQSEKECCGQYPIRWPFKTQGGDRDCCQGRTFNAALNQCCADGSTRPTC